MEVELITKKDLEELENRILSAIRQKPADAVECWLSFDEAAEYLRFKPRKLGDRVRSKEIPHIREGRAIRFRRADLDRYMMQHRVMSRDEVDSAARNRTK